MSTRIHGLIKFFGNSDFLEQFMNGRIYCNTPEFYRMSSKPGTSDPFESCVYSYRANRDKVPPNISIDGVALEEISGLTMRVPNGYDAWMHCWFIVQELYEKSELHSLAEDLKNVADNFGLEYVYLPAGKMREFGSRLHENSPLKASFIPVKYSQNRFEWSIACKAKSYSYQRELRYIFGECDDLCIDSYYFDCPEGFKDIIMVNPTMRLSTADFSTKMYLSKGGVYVSNE